MKLHIILPSILLLTACAPQMTPEQQAALAADANRPVTCKAGKDCEEKWSRAVQWIKQNSSYKIQTISDNIIQTYGPLENDPSSGFSITKVAEGHNSYTIDFSAACDNWIGCIPSVIELKASFANYVMGMSHQ